MPRTENPTFEDGLFRQRERTVDNIKRIYAVVYSISFTNILREIFDFSQSFLTGHLAKGFASGLQLRLTMLLIFGATVSVFAYQADKFLDLRYALRPETTDPKMPHWDKWDFAIDAGSLILTLIPFTLMSYSFSRQLVDRYGIIPFLLGYLLQLGLSVTLLLVVRLKYVLCAAKPTTPQAPNSALSEVTRYAALSIHWFITNGVTMLLLTGGFCIAWSLGSLCGTALRTPLSWFVGFFVAVALIRNVVDFTAVWPFLYMNTRSLKEDELPPLMRIVVGSPLEFGFVWWDLAGALSVVAFIVAAALSFPALSQTACPAPSLAVATDAPVPSAGGPGRPHDPVRLNESPR